MNLHYIKKIEEDVLIISLYVDDLLVMGKKNMEFVNKFKAEMEHVFKMTNLGVMSCFLGMKVRYKKKKKRFSYAKEIQNGRMQAYVYHYESEREFM